MDGFINMKLLGNPINWIIVTLVLIFGFYSAYAIWTNKSSLLPTIPRSPI